MPPAKKKTAAKTAPARTEETTTGRGDRYTEADIKARQAEFAAVLEEINGVSYFTMELEDSAGGVRTMQGIVRVDDDGARITEGSRTFWLEEGYGIRRFY